MPIRSVTDLLAEQPEEALLRMREAAKEQLDRLTVEIQMIDQALARKSRRGSPGGRLTRQQVYDVVAQAGRPVKPAEVHQLIVEAGVNASANSVRNHLARMHEDGELGRLDDGSYAVISILPAASADDDIPF